MASIRRVTLIVELSDGSVFELKDGYSSGDNPKFITQDLLHNAQTLLWSMGNLIEARWKGLVTQNTKFVNVVSEEVK